MPALSNTMITDFDEKTFIEEVLNKKNGDTIYIGDDDVRFVLGEVGDNPLICIGVNPSIADDMKDDPTIKRIKRIVEENNNDGWIMLNLYPQRKTKPKELHKIPNKEYEKENIKVIQSVFNMYSDALVLACWGNTIDKFDYLKVALKEILTCSLDRKWRCRGNLTLKRNPRHQLGVPYNTPLNKIGFDNILKCFIVE